MTGRGMQEHMTISRRIASLLGAALLAAVPAAQAAPLSFFLDRSNKLADGINYAQVTIADGADGAIDFTVTPLQPLLDLGGDKFEIRQFAFNLDPELDFSDAEATGLPNLWSLRGTRRMDGFGRFDLSIVGTGPANITSLAFSIIGVDGDTPESYVDFSREPAKEGPSYFAAWIRGIIDDGGCDKKDGKCGGNAINNAFIGGSSEVPLPATAWMFLTGMAGVALRARRRVARASRG